MIASEVSVHPEIVSTSNELALTISPGRSLRAWSAMPAVSPWAVIMTSVMAVSETVTSTVTSPLWPSAVPVYVPALKAAAEEEEHPASAMIAAEAISALKFFMLFFVLVTLKL